ncbi:hypothetical protein BDQ17DRAFT_420773 [Cyathus striatus]|nr:hypothetical protein BDQ17DRAFT_420773 [Cyathus striatus]
MPIAQRTLSRYRTALHGLPFRAFSISSPAPALQFPRIWATNLPVTRLSELRVQARTLHAPPYFPSVASSIPTGTLFSRILYRRDGTQRSKVLGVIIGLSITSIAVTLFTAYTKNPKGIRADALHIIMQFQAQPYQQHTEGLLQFIESTRSILLRTPHPQ